MKKKIIILLAVIISLCLAIGYKINSDNEAIENRLFKESEKFIVEAAKIRILIIEGGDNPYHKDVNTDYFEITDTRIDTKDELLNMMENYFTREYAEKNLINYFLKQIIDYVCIL